MKLRSEKNRRRMSTRARVTVTLVVFVVALSTVIGLLLWMTGSIDAVVKRAVLSQDIILMNMETVRTTSEQIRDGREIILAGSDDYSAYERHKKTALAGFERWKQSIADSVETLGGSRGSELEREHTVLLDAVELEYLAVSARVDEALELYGAGDVNTARLLVTDVLQDDYETRLLPVMERVNTEERAIADRAVRDMESTSRLASVLSVVVGLSAAAVAVVISVVLLRDIVVSTRKLGEGAQTLGAGDLDARVDVGEGGDFALLAEAFNDMASRLKASREELEHANAELKGYAHVVSHDLRGPLSNLGMSSDLMKEVLRGPQGEDSRREMAELIGTFDNSIARLGALISDLLALAEAGQKPAEVAVVDVNQVVREILQELEVRARERGVRFEVEGDLGTVEANRTHVYQLFVNLIRNAVNHSESPEPVVRVSFLGTDREGRRRYRVSDNGPGIPGDLQEIFQPFVKTGSGGTGLGLAIVSRILEVYGGEVSAYNDGGACFEFSLAGPGSTATPPSS